ncbi:hypothetical protein OSB04_010119 [Centaurea solstitialis]|uniref:Lipoxygenase n=1 Tax=Centaurea solstitialis TaxID=347529 RepID=A0AA38TIQ1_9ASTR|nr:hypothetical protein OSB04_010119 [Centaurea solstitialis]
MLSSPIFASQTIHNHLPLHNPFVGATTTIHPSSSAAAYSPTSLSLPNPTKKSNTRYIPARHNINAISTALSFITKSTTVKDLLKQLLGIPPFNLQLVSVDLDSNGNQKTVEANASFNLFEFLRDPKRHIYDCNFQVPTDFGDIGAVLVKNNFRQDFFFKTIALDDKITFTCDSWVHSTYDNPERRIFFSDKSYLPSDTPNGMKLLRTKDLESLRGNGEGERKSFERIYDYDVYNDVGSPDISESLLRPVLGGQEHPYPRRCRTGRAMSKADPSSESRTLTLFYIPRDEDFSEIKDISFSVRGLSSALHGVIPILAAVFTDKDAGFSSFTEINSLYNEGVHIPGLDKGLLSILPNLIDAANSAIKFDTPELIERDTFAWSRDDEFCRQMVAGINPYKIQLVTEWPLMSKLDPEVYGPAESSITKEIVEQELKGVMTFEEALEQKKLFMLDYHDILLPYVNKVRELDDTILYGSRTLMFLTPTGTLQPLAIELTRPPTDDGKPQWNRVYTPNGEATDGWLWKIAKAQVLSHDSFYHQLVSHWLRTHCAQEPYVIATNRHLSQMHPINRLLSPFFRYTMQINALARQLLINAQGIIETTFGPGEYNVLMSSDVYDQEWRFDQESLPGDLIKRGMAVEDPSAEYGLKLAIEDYPFANDGLLIWDAIKEFVTSYVTHYYPEDNLIKSDEELQAWWTEIRTVGHGDKKDEPWWPQLKTQDDLIQIVSTMMWVPSGHHATVNFGQYDYAGYFPNRPSTSRVKMPDEEPTAKEWENFLTRPESVLLDCFPSKIQAVTIMVVLDVLSSHSLDEAYIGGNAEAAWAAEPTIKVAYDVFSQRLKELEGIIDSRNVDPELRNRSGAGLIPFTLLKPDSEPGVTGKEPWSESRTTLPFYVPRDEDFSGIKGATFGVWTLYSILHAVLPTLDSVLMDKKKGFWSFRDINSLYDKGFNIPPLENGLLSALPRILKDEWPLMSKLDPEVYGPAESAISEEIIEQEIKGFMTFEEALEQKKLFLLDYHDLLLPNTETATIELTHPPNNGKPQWKHVYAPCWDASSWLWKLAKVRVLAHFAQVTISSNYVPVNFGQYDYAGYFPNRPTIARTKMPNEDPTPEEWQTFLKNPELVLLNCFPSQVQGTKVMFILDVLSSHSPDEKYIGIDMEAAWEAEPVIKIAFHDFNRRLKELECVIDLRNNDPNLSNRYGAGLMPYQLLKPFSEVTNKLNTRIRPDRSRRGYPGSIRAPD